MGYHLPGLKAPFSNSTSSAALAASLNLTAAKRSLRRFTEYWRPDREEERAAGSIWMGGNYRGIRDVC